MVETDRLKKIFTFLLFWPFFLGACMNLKQPRKKIEYYTLEYDAPRIADFKPLPYVIRLERFTVAPTYNSNSIVYRDQSFKRNAYVYYKWQTHPGDLATHFIGRDIRQSGLFKAVLPHDSRLPPSHVLEGRVDEFVEWDTDDSWQAVLSISVTFIAENEPDPDKRILFQKTYGATEPCTKKNPGALAEAMSRAMAMVSRQIMEDVYLCLE